MNTPAIAGTLFAIFCLWMLRHARSNLRAADASRHWPSARGRMVRVELWGNRNVDGQAKPVERLSVEYEYEVRGVAHRGTRVAFHTLVYPETLAFAGEHPAGSALTVFYRPDDPATAVLVPGGKGGGKRYSEVILAAAGLLVAVSVAVLGAAGLIG